MNVNPAQFVQMMMNKNPMLSNNPMIGNAIRMANNNDSVGLEKMARNLAKEKGVNIDEVKNQVMRQFGML